MVTKKLLFSSHTVFIEVASGIGKAGYVTDWAVLTAKDWGGNPKLFALEFMGEESFLSMSFIPYTQDQNLINITRMALSFYLKPR